MGALIITSARSDLQGGVHLVRAHPTEAIRHNAVHPTTHQRGPRRSTVLSARGSWAIAPRTPGRCAQWGFQHHPHWVARSATAAMLNWTSFKAFERGYVVEAPIRVIPRIGSAYKPKGYSSHPPNPLSILLCFLSEQLLSLSLFK